MKTEGRQANDWLREVTKDQNLEDLDDVTLTRMDRARRWFASRILQPMFKTGYYDSNTGLFVLGSPSDSYTWESEFTTASAAALTLTCPAGYRYEIVYAAAWNATQVSTCTASASIAGNTMSLIVGTSGTAVNSGMVMGGFNGATAITLTGPIGLSAGDTFTLTLNTYAAGNDTEHQIIFRSYKVA